MDVLSLSTAEITSFWKQYCVHIQQLLSPAVYNTWILSNPVTDIQFVGSDRATVIITSPTAFHATNLQKNLHTNIKQVFDSILSRSCTVEYQVGDASFRRPQQHSDSVTTAKPFEAPINFGFVQAAPAATAQPTTNYTAFPQTSTHSPRVEDLFSESSLSNAAQDRIEAQARGIGLRVDYTFETFAVSTTNEMAHAAATAVSNRPGQSYNPLFLYGGVGVGKTHLMQAIGNNILKNNPAVRILYCTGEEFTNEIVNAIQTKKARNFKEKYRTVDVLLIDDIQFIAGKNAVQEEFFHTFNALTKIQHQIVLTSDRPPHEITLLEDRLRSRFEAGLMIDIQQPSFELRTAILLVKSKAQNLPISIDMAKTIASRVDSARKIEGIITSIRSEIELKRKQLTPELIDEILQLEIETKRPKIKVAPGDIIKTVANHYHIKQTSLKGHSRVKNLVTARHICMFLMKKELSLPLTEIGRWFAGRDHTSVLHAVNKVEKDMNINDALQQDISALRTTLTSISR